MGEMWQDGWLRCPYCGSELRSEGSGESTSNGSYGVLRCDCYRYPVVEGIPILWQCSGPADTKDAVVACIDRGDTSAAFSAAISRLGKVEGAAAGRTGGGLIQRLRAWLESTSDTNAEKAFDGDLRDCLRVAKTRGYADYLFYRYANISLLGTIPLLTVLQSALRETAEKSDEASPRTPPAILDLCCGIGHSSFLINALLPECRIVAADHDFFNLVVARRFFADDVCYVCMDAEAPLPFADNQFLGVICNDAFHYIRRKRLLAEEIRRAITPNGICVLAHLHNSASHNFAPGIPVPARRYAGYFHCMSVSMFDEEALLSSYARSGAVETTSHNGLEMATGASAFSLLAAGGGLRSKYDRIDSALIAALGRHLDLNPVYEPHASADGVDLALKWPNAALRAECLSVEALLPLETTISADLAAALAAGSLDAADPELRRTVRSGILVPLAPGYPKVLREKQW